MGSKSRIEESSENAGRIAKIFIHVAQAISYLIALNAIIQATIAVVGPCNLGYIFSVFVLAGIWLIPLFIYECYKIRNFYGSNRVKNKGVKVLAFLLELILTVSFNVLFPVLGSLVAVAPARTNIEIASMEYFLTTLILSPVLALFIGVLEPFLIREFEKAFSKGIEELGKSNKMRTRSGTIAAIITLIVLYAIPEILLLNKLTSLYSTLIQLCR